VTPWLSAFSSNPGCGGGTNRSLDNVVAPAKVAADVAGFDPSRYDDVIYAIADSKCGFHGTTWGNEVILTRQPNLQLVVHELGHAFQGYSSRDKAVLDYMSPTLESAEVHSMSLEYLTWAVHGPLLGSAAQAYRDAHLSESIMFLPYGVAVDHFQHLVYETPNATPDASLGPTTGGSASGQRTATCGSVPREGALVLGIPVIRRLV